MRARAQGSERTPSRPRPGRSRPSTGPATVRPHRAPNLPSPSPTWPSAYRAVRRMLSLVVLAFRSSGSEEVEILVLRHEFAVLRRNQPLPHLGTGRSDMTRRTEPNSATEAVVSLWRAPGGSPRDISTPSTRAIPARRRDRHPNRWRWSRTIQPGGTSGSEASSWLGRRLTVKFLLRYRDNKFGPGLQHPRPSPLHTASTNPSTRTERRTPSPSCVVKTLRSELTDRLLIVNEGHLRRVLDPNVRHYNE